MERDRLNEYRAHAHDAYDSTLFKLSGAALGLSLAFARQFVGDEPLRSAGALTAAWVLWATSLALSLASHYASGLAMERAIKQSDEGEEASGEPYARATRLLNLLGGVAFVLGAISAIIFVKSNL